MSAFLAPRSFVRLVFTKLFQSAAVVTLASAGAITGEADAATFNGSIPGSFSVSPTGAATYSIPIEVPPGIGGMTPQLSLNYSSQAGNGLLGVGWTLGGLSAITRCPATLAQDGFIDGVDFDADDRFCLDGQRLVPVPNSGGCSGHTEYRTEVDAYARICAYGTSGDGPGWFQVSTKAGQIIEYGHSADSRIEAQGRWDVLVWNISSSSDTSGNYIRYEYSENRDTTESYPTRIGYGYVNGSADPAMTVEFSYKAGSEAEDFNGYVAGSKVERTQVLDSIKVKRNGVSSAIHVYDFTHTITAPDWMLRLTDIRKCSSGACSAITTVDWDAKGQLLSTQFKSNNTSWGYDSGRAWVDVSGDGRADLCRVVGTDSAGYSINCKLATESGFGGAWSANLGGGAGYEGSRWWTDITGDGLADYCSIIGGPANPSGYVLRCILASTSGFSGTVSRTNLSPGYEGSRWMTDFNGDGREDYCRLLGTQTDGYIISCTVSGDSGFGATYNSNRIFSAGQEGNRWWVDFNGDGMSDYCRLRGDAASGYVLSCTVSTGAGYGATYSSDTIHDAGLEGNRWWVDQNGDGYPDFCRLRSTVNGHILACIQNTGAGFASTITSDYFSAIGIEESRNWADINADGRADFCRVTPGGGTYYLRCMMSVNGGFGLTASSDPISWQTEAGGNWADVTGDGLVEFCHYTGAVGSSSAPINCVTNSGSSRHQVSKISDGIGNEISLTHSPATYAAVYERLTGGTYPENVDFQAPMPVTKTVETRQPDGSTRSIAYHYKGLRLNRQGRGLLGFNTVTATDLQTDFVTTTTYRQTFPFIGLAESVQAELKNAQRPFKRKTNVWNKHQSYPGVYQIRNNNSTEEVYELNGDMVSIVSVDNQMYDEFGNVRNVIVTSQASNETRVKTTVNTYSDDPVRWHLGRLTRSHVTVGAESRTSAFEYHPTTGLLTAEIIEPDDPQFMLRTEYEYDEYGNKRKVTVHDSDSNEDPLASSTSSYDYSQLAVDGTYKLTNTNAAGHREIQRIDARFGKPLKLTGPNGLDTEWTYDAFGRVTRETRADGTVTATAYDSCASGCVGVALYKVTTTSTGSPSVTVEYDSLGREVRSQTVDLEGDPIYRRTTYNGLGQVASVSRPYRSGTPLTTDYTYDVLGRVTQEVSPDGGVVTTQYAGLTTTITRSSNNYEYTPQEVSRITDVEGNLISVIDEGGGETRYTYDAFGNLTSVTDPAENVTTMSYDKRGRKTAMNDPDMGNWEYRYDALGQLRWQKDAKGQEVSMVYDALGRMISRTEPEGISTWTYDQPGSKGIGKLWKVSGPDGYSEIYTYDDKGRPSQTLQTFDGRNFTTASSYDASGRLDVLTYPSGFRLKHGYSASGYLNTVGNADNAGETFWTWTAQDVEAYDEFHSEALGNGLQTVRTVDLASGRLTAISTRPAELGGDVQGLRYEYDSLGNLTKRRDDLLPAKEESFQYDHYNRLVQAKIDGIATPKTWTYDSIGNIKSKDGYADYTYGSAGTKPHAVTVARGSPYTYDANGNMESGGGRTFTWNSANLPARIQKGGAIAAFSYGPDRARYKQDTVTGGAEVRTLYVGKLYEQVSANGVVTHKNYIAAAGRVVAIREVVEQQVTMKYLHQDHLGSIDVITDATGQVLERQSFDAFGTRRVATDWRDPIAWIGSLYSTRGYTGHEMLDGVGLIHMNGRVYDPELGRFISADPQILYPENGQNHNRYSYVNNNPTKYVDMSGYGFFDDVWDNVFDDFFGIDAENENLQPIVQIGATLVCGGNVACGAWASAAIGAGFTLANGGSFWDAAKAGVIGYSTVYAFNWAGGVPAGSELGVEHFARHALVGCASGAASGGSCGRGAMSAMAGLAGTPYGFVGAVVAGGTASAIGGGKFANGAMTAAFGYLYNHCNHNSCTTEDGLWFEFSAADLPSAPQGLVDGVAGFGDTFGARWMRDAFGVDGGINYDSLEYRSAEVIGTFTPGLGTATALRVTAYIGRSVRWLNQGRYWRIGPGVISRSAGMKPFNYGAGRNIPMLRIGNGQPSSLNHFDLRILGR